jgi:MFS family permease
MSTIDSTASFTEPHTLSYERGAAMRRYMILYALAAIAGSAVWGGVGGVLLPLHVQQIEFAAKAGNLATIKAVAVAVTMVLQPLIGIASDRTRSRWGRRAPWLVAGSIATVAGLIAMQYSSSFAQLLAGWIVAQVGVTMIIGPLGATVADRMPAAQRGVMSAVAGIGLLVGFVVGTTVAGALFGRLHLGSYLVFAAAVLVFSLWFVLAARDRPSLSLQLQPTSVATHLLSCTYALRDADFRWVWIARVLMMFGYAAAATYTVYMLQSYIEPAQTAAQAAKTVSLLYLASLPGTFLGMAVTGRWSDRAMRRKPFVIGASFLLAASMLVPFAWPTLAALYVQFVVGGVAFGTFLAVDQALLIDVLPNTSAAGRDLGMGQFAANLGSMLGPVLAGGVLSATGGYHMVWLASSVLAMFAAFALMRARTAA